MDETYIKIKGKSPWTQQQVAEMLILETEALYTDDPENSPYDESGNMTKIGFTAVAIVQLCR